MLTVCPYFHVKSVVPHLHIYLAPSVELSELDARPMSFDDFYNQSTERHFSIVLEL